MKTAARRRDAGFTLYEIIVAVLLFGVVLHPVVTTLSANTRISTDRRDRLDAERILRNESALLTVANPTLAWSSRSYRADRSGRAREDGPFQVETRRSVRCSVGDAPLDNHAAPPIAGCARGGVLVDYASTVRFPRSAGSRDSGIVTHTFSVGGAEPSGGEIGTLP